MEGLFSEIFLRAADDAATGGDGKRGKEKKNRKTKLLFEKDVDGRHAAVRLEPVCLQRLFSP